MNIAFVGHGNGTTMSEQKVGKRYVIKNGTQAWHQEVIVGKHLKQALLNVLNYNDITETIDEGTVYVLNSLNQDNLYGLDWLFSKVAYKLAEAHPEVQFKWIQQGNKESRDLYLSQMDIIIVFMQGDYGHLTADLRQLNRNCTIIDAQTLEEFSINREHAY